MLFALVYSMLRLLLDLVDVRLRVHDPEVELLLLRHQLRVVRRQVKRPQLTLRETARALRRGRGAARVWSVFSRVHAFVLGPLFFLLFGDVFLGGLICLMLRGGRAGGGVGVRASKPPARSGGPPTPRKF